LVAGLAAAAAAFVTAAGAAPADAGVAHFRYSVEGKQTATWGDTLESDSCARIRRDGAQTISFTTTRQGTLRVARRGRYTWSERGRDVRTSWNYLRSYEETVVRPAGCEGESPWTPRPSDCGAKGPDPVPLSLKYDGRRLELYGLMNGLGRGQHGPDYETCDFDGYHETDLLDGLARMPVKKLMRIGTLRVPVSARSRVPITDGLGSQTTVLSAVVTLERVR
jgi:hypothetical protein